MATSLSSSMLSMITRRRAFPSCTQFPTPNSLRTLSALGRPASSAFAPSSHPFSTSSPPPPSSSSSSSSSSNATSSSSSSSNSPSASASVLSGPSIAARVFKPTHTQSKISLSAKSLLNLDPPTPAVPPGPHEQAAKIEDGSADTFPRDESIQSSSDEERYAPEPLHYREPIAAPLPPEPEDLELAEPPIVLDYSDSVVDGKPFDFLSTDKELENRFVKRANRLVLKAKIKKRSAEPPLPVERLTRIDSQGRAHGTGGRKTATARVWISPGTGFCYVNGKRNVEYFESLDQRLQYMLPFEATGTQLQFDVSSIVSGGGKAAQAIALRHGVANALQHWNPLFRPLLRDEGYLTRDPRMVERKHTGRRKARRAFQWVKR